MRLKNLLETANEGFWEVDDKGITVDVNPEMCSILGRPMDEIIGHSLYEFGDLKDRDLIKEQTKIWEQQKKSEYEGTLIRPDGRRRRNG